MEEVATRAVVEAEEVAMVVRATAREASVVVVVVAAAIIMFFNFHA